MFWVNWFVDGIVFLVFGFFGMENWGFIKYCEINLLLMEGEILFLLKESIVKFVVYEVGY